MGTKLNITDKRFGKLVAIRISDKGSDGIYRWLCKCDCGNEYIVKVSALMYGNTKSCGCLQKLVASKNGATHKKHGCGTVGKITKEYSTWVRMKNRCYNEKTPSYKYYGGRNIKVCDRWLHSFENFLEDMGNKPTPKYSIERDDVNGDYTPENCRWATNKEQCGNRRTNRWLEYNGERMILQDWAIKLNIDVRRLHSQLKRESFDTFMYYYNNYGIIDRRTMSNIYL